MKKLISFLLVVMMLCSMSVSAFATSSLNVGEGENNFKVATDKKSASQDTDIWLQVEANGQIDVKVPLLLVFKTNIDGGNATTPTKAYQITNNSTADLTVTNVTAVNAQNNGLTLTNYAAKITNVDYYGVQLKSGDFEFDAKNGIEPKTALEGGLLTLPKVTIEDNSGTQTRTPNPVAIDVSMTTGPLSFVTKQKTVNNEQVLDDTMGVQVMTITYTVAIKTDNNTAKGTDITGTKTGTVYTGGTAKDVDVTYDYPVPASGS